MAMEDADCNELLKLSRAEENLEVQEMLILIFETTSGLKTDHGASQPGISGCRQSVTSK
jgi:hypothetical protein